VNDKGTFNISGGGGCNAAGGAGRGAAGSFLWLLGLVWLVGRNRRRPVPTHRGGKLRDRS
jgi:MYXO-CTERM domain-containing protein